MTQDLVELRHVGKSFAGVRALDDVSLTIRTGEIHCLAGENGSGKSTLIKLMAGVYAPDQGEIRFAGERVDKITPQDSVRRGVQVIYQDFSLFGNLTVAENLALNTLLAEGRRAVSWRRVRGLAREALARIRIDIDLDAEVDALPTAQKQLVAIARALAADARLIIMDEPTTALTGKEIATLFEIVRDIQGRGIAVLFVSHKIGEMLAISERITVIRNGRKVAESPTSALSESAIVRHMTGRDIAAERYSPELPRGAVPRLELRDVALAGRLDRINLRLDAGEIVGVSGLLGSGRTDLARLLFGLEPRYGGSVLVDGREVRLSGVAEAIGRGIAYVPEDRLTEGLFLSQSIKRNIMASILDRLSGHIFLNESRAARAAAATIADMQITAKDVERPVGQLSGGNQQRVMIGRWLHTEPRILVLNGPTVGVDVGSKAEIHRRIREIVVSRGLAVLMISDDLPELLHNCNRILMMHRGRIVDEIAAGAASEESLSAKLKELR
ncbi:MAG: sugar ABC transporter ATP-binding protein [Parvibaculaceae bacterium]